MTATASPLLLTLGYGKRSIDEAIGLLERHGVRFLIDARSAPCSRYHPDFLNLFDDLPTGEAAQSRGQYRRTDK